MSTFVMLMSYWSVICSNENGSNNSGDTGCQTCGFEDLDVSPACAGKDLHAFLDILVVDVGPMRDVEWPVYGTLDVVHVAFSTTVEPRDVIIPIQGVASAFFTLQVLGWHRELVFLSAKYRAAIAFLSVKSALAGNLETLGNHITVFGFQNIVGIDLTRILVVIGIAFVGRCKNFVSLFDLLNSRANCFMSTLVAIIFVFRTEKKKGEASVTIPSIWLKVFVSELFLARYFRLEVVGIPAEWLALLLRVHWQALFIVFALSTDGRLLNIGVPAVKCVQALRSFLARSIWSLQSLASRNVGVLRFLRAVESRIAIGMRVASVRIQASLALATFLVTLHCNTFIMRSAVTSRILIIL